MKATSSHEQLGNKEWTDIRALKSAMRRSAAEKALLLTRPRRAAPRALILDTLHTADD